MGELLDIDAGKWSLDVSQFVRGDFNTILSFDDYFDDLPRSDRYILVNALRDGRVLKNRLSVTRQGASFLLRGHVEPSFSRITADQLGSHGRSTWKPAISTQKTVRPNFRSFDFGIFNYQYFASCF
jgi:hypothetical protein